MSNPEDSLFLFNSKLLKVVSKLERAADLNPLGQGLNDVEHEICERIQGKLEAAKKLIEESLQELSEIS